MRRYLRRMKQSAIQKLYKRRCEIAEFPHLEQSRQRMEAVFRSRLVEGRNGSGVGRLRLQCCPMDRRSPGCAGGITRHPLHRELRVPWLLTTTSLSFRWFLDRFNASGFDRANRHRPANSAIRIFSDSLWPHRFVGDYFTVPHARGSAMVLRAASSFIAQRGDWR